MGAFFIKNTQLRNQMKAKNLYEYQVYGTWFQIGKNLTL
jgi:hypothetical protein